MTADLEKLRRDYRPPADESRMCFCVGPQNGDPVCPCEMRNVVIRNGRYVSERDLGPVPKRSEDWVGVTGDYNIKRGPQP